MICMCSNTCMALVGHTEDDMWHVEHSSGEVRTACDIQIDGRRGAGRPKLTWKKLTEKYCCEWKLTTVGPQERST